MHTVILKMAWILLLAVLLSCCKATKESKAGKPVATEQNMEEAAAQKSADLTVSFFSPGNGIDRKKLEEFTAFLSKKYPDIKYERSAWGKEGEVDLCFDLSEMKPAKKEAFVDEVKKSVEDSERVRVKENQPCGGRRRN